MIKKPKNKKGVAKAQKIKNKKKTARFRAVFFV